MTIFSAACPPHRLRMLYLPLLTCVAGCGGANFGSELAARPKASVVSDVGAAPIKLPADREFSIFSASSSKDTGLGGVAEPTASAAPDGTAEVRAKAADGGEASAVFQLGHAFENKSNAQIDLAFVVRFHFAFAAQSSPLHNSVDGSVGLKLYARDDRNRLLRNDEMIAYPLDKGPTQSSGQRDFRFTVTLGPGRSVSVLLAGQTQVKAKPGRSGDCKLSVSGLSIDAVSQAAPVPRAATDEQG